MNQPIHPDDRTPTGQEQRDSAFSKLHGPIHDFQRTATTVSIHGRHEQSQEDASEHAKVLIELEAELRTLNDRLSQLYIENIGG